LLRVSLPAQSALLQPDGLRPGTPLDNERPPARCLRSMGRLGI
jgi:hypothetical protein